MKKFIQIPGLILLLIVFLNGCTLTRGSSVVVGKVRAPISASEVKLYTKLPAKYKEIAIVSADSRNDFASKQNLTDAAINRLKEEAAKVGANGILLNSVGDYYIGSSGVVISPNTNNPVTTGTAAMNARTGKEARGMAIYVVEE